MSVEEELAKRTDAKWYNKQNVKKWGITTMLIPFIPFGLTQMDKYFEERSYQQTLKAIMETQPLVLKLIRAEVSAGIRNYRIEDDQVSNETKVAVYAKIVLVQSIDKVSFITRELDNCLATTTCDKISAFQKRQLMRRIKVELYRQSGVYVRLLNSMENHPVLGKVGDYLAKTFPMEGDTELMEGDFMKDLEEIVFMTGLTPREKSDAIMNYMKDIQQQYFALVLDRMNGRY